MTSHCMNGAASNVCTDAKGLIARPEKMISHSAVDCTLNIRRPNRHPVMANKHLVTNHQEQVEWHEYAVATGSVDRAHFLALRLDCQWANENRPFKGDSEPANGCLFCTAHSALFSQV